MLKLGVSRASAFLKPSTTANATTTFAGFRVCAAHRTGGRGNCLRWDRRLCFCGHVDSLKKIKDINTIAAPHMIAATIRPLDMLIQSIRP